MRTEVENRDSVPMPSPTDGGTPAEASAQLLERIVDKLGGRARTATVFGDPIVAEGVTIVPVSRAGFGFGGGMGRDVGADKVSGGGGGGGGLDVRPVGFIEIRDGGAQYRPIRDPWADVVVPLAAITAGMAAPRLLRTGLRLYRSRRR